MIVANGTLSSDAEIDTVLIVVAFVSGAMVGAAACATVGSAVASKTAAIASVAAVGWRAVLRWLTKVAKTVRRFVKRRRND